MDQHLIYFAPFLMVGLGIMLAPFVSDRWPDPLVRFVEFCAEMVNGVWVAGVALVILISLDVLLPGAAIASWAVMFFAGRFFARRSEEWDARSRDIRLRAWEERRRREKEERANRR